MAYDTGLNEQKMDWEEEFDESFQALESLEKEAGLNRDFHGQINEFIKMFFRPEIMKAKVRVLSDLVDEIAETKDVKKALKNLTLRLKDEAIAHEEEDRKRKERMMGGDDERGKEELGDYIS